jgi:hypothetical protein
VSKVDWSVATWPVLALAGLPLVAVVCLAMLARASISGGVKLWGLWAALLVGSCVVWVYVFSETP